MYREGSREIVPGALGETIPGYPPLEINRGQDGKLYRGSLEFVPSQDMPIGPEAHHLQVFLEYEQTFGRGKAKQLTHDIELRHRADIETKYGTGFGDDYERLRDGYDQAASRSTQADAEAYIQLLRSYRMRYPKLYEDADGYRKKDPGPSRIKITG